MRLILIVAFTLLLLPLVGYGQSDTLPPDLDYVQPTEYEIGGVRVKGAEFSDDNAIISISGLRVGHKIRIPGTETESAIRVLWKQRLFTDVKVSIYKVIGDIAFLEIEVEEQPRLTGHTLRKIKKAHHDDINDLINSHIRKGTIVSTQVKEGIKKKIEEFYIEKGFLDTEVRISEMVDTSRINGTKLVVEADRKKKIKIHRINITGNTKVKASKLRRKMKNTHDKRRLFASTKYIHEDYKEDKISLIQYYNKLGYRDATIMTDTMYRGEKGLVIDIDVKEGNQYFFRNIKWKGQSIYTKERLETVLGIKKGDVYNTELLETRLRFSQDGRDISSLYLDNGYLSFRIDPVETAVENDSIDVVMRIFEGPQFTIDKVVVRGNDRTHENVIRRELRTKPGQKFSRAAIIRSQRELMNLGYFNQESFGIQTPINPQRGTVDIEYEVEEKPSDQLELSAGYQPGRDYGSYYQRGGLIGTLGVTFSNFSISDMFKKSAWRPYPQGGGQVLSIRGQMQGSSYRGLNMSFTEPWLGGKKPTSLTSSLAYTHFGRSYTDTSFIQIINGTVSLGTRLKFPDDNFIGSLALSTEFITLNKYAGIFRSPEGDDLYDGLFNNLAVIANLTRSTVNDPLFPKNGSRFSLVAKLTPPYSVFREDNSNFASVEEKYKFLEYHKYRFTAEWYTSLGAKFVLKTGAKLGYLGHYNKEIGTSPFERFELGGDAFNQQSFQLAGREYITLRGYDDDSQTFPANPDGASIFNKFTAELRYPLSLNPSSTIYLLSFVEAGNAWDSFREYDPFELRRSAGLGLRVFLPMFGTIGFDYGIGFDKPWIENGSNFSDYGKFNIIIGVEPE